jgi:hypothetical protein
MVNMRRTIVLIPPSKVLRARCRQDPIRDLPEDQHGERSQCDCKQRSRAGTLQKRGRWSAYPSPRIAQANTPRVISTRYRSGCQLGPQDGDKSRTRQRQRDIGPSGEVRSDRLDRLQTATRQRPVKECVALTKPELTYPSRWHQLAHLSRTPMCCLDVGFQALRTVHQDPAVVVSAA